MTNLLYQKCKIILYQNVIIQCIALNFKNLIREEEVSKKHPPTCITAAQLTIWGSFQRISLPRGNKFPHDTLLIYFTVCYIWDIYMGQATTVSIDNQLVYCNITVLVISTHCRMINDVREETINMNKWLQRHYCLNLGAENKRTVQETAIYIPPIPPLVTNKRAQLER